MDPETRVSLEKTVHGPRRFLPLSWSRGAWISVLFLGLAGARELPAQTPAASPAPSHPAPMLDNDDLARLQTARQQVLNENPDLQAEEAKLKAMHEAATHQTPPAPADQRNAMFAEWKAYQKKMRAAMLRIDPTLGPLFAKLDDARKHGAPTPFQPATGK